MPKDPEEKISVICMFICPCHAMGWDGLGLQHMPCLCLFLNIDLVLFLNLNSRQK